MKKDISLGLTFSGGGYRAASFSLGVLTYLDRVKMDDENCLLSKVVALSNVSGGTITGARYAIGIKQGETLETIYKSLYSFMTEVDLVSLGIDRLISKDRWGQQRIKSLINAFADVYDEQLFNHSKFKTLMNEDPYIHLKHVSFNATEFATALPFRFQWSEQIVKPKTGEHNRGIIGNFNYRIPEIIVREIRLADILAASSCFPGGFEPINFPNDFVLPHKTRQLVNSSDKLKTIGLMDGGIVDNQGIEALLLANDRIKRNIDDTPGKPTTEPAIDLIIVSDVASPYMEEYVASIQTKNNWWRKLSPKSFMFLFSFSSLLSGVGLFLSICYAKLGFLILTTAFLTISLICLSVLIFVFSVPKRVEILKPFKIVLRKFLKLKLQVYENMLINRGKSVMKMVGEVSLKRIRKLNYEKIFENDMWKNRRIMSSIYELRPGESGLQNKINNHRISKALIPSEKIQAVSALASKMGTTLWFTKDELKGENNMINSIIACGQYTICWNLLEYIEKIKKDNTNTNPNHSILLELETQMLEDWEKFKLDPYWLVSYYNQIDG